MYYYYLHNSYINTVIEISGKLHLRESPYHLAASNFPEDMHHSYSFPFNLLLALLVILNSCSRLNAFLLLVAYGVLHLF